MIQLKPGLQPSTLAAKERKSLNHRRKNNRKTTRKKNRGLRFDRVFSDSAVSPFDQMEWERRTAEITDDSGKVIFKQENIEVPKSWSPLATKIAVAKYFYGDVSNGTDPHAGGRETSVRQLIHRVTRTLADCGRADGYFADEKTAEIFYDELTWLCANQYGAFNSPVWFNVGSPDHELPGQKPFEADANREHGDPEQIHHSKNEEQSRQRPSSSRCRTPS